MNNYYDIFEMVYLKWCLQKKICAKRKNISFDKSFLSNKRFFTTEIGAVVHRHGNKKDNGAGHGIRRGQKYNCSCALSHIYPGWL